jgi:hypothetical protein
MTTVHYDYKCSDDERRKLLYGGDLFVYSPSRHSIAMVDLARDMLAAAFGNRDPQSAQFDVSVEEFAAVLAQLKPKFIHHPECKRLLPALLADLGCDLGQTYFDVPRLRSSTSDNYLTTGIAYAFHPHRDTWYSAPMCQINFWFPVFPITTRNAMAFHPRYFDTGVRNSSAGYNYQQWNRTSRYQAAQQIGVDTRTQPKALEPVELQPDIRLLPPPGGLIMFSAAQLHSSVPNDSGRTRYSIDFRTVHAGDALGLQGAANVDSACTGSTMGDYLRCTDLAHLAPEVMAAYDAGPPKPASRQL